MNRSRFRSKTTFEATGSLMKQGLYDTGGELALQSLRDRILRNVLVGSIIFGILAFIATLPPRLAAGQYVLIGIFGASLVSVIIVTLSKRSPYNLRVMSFLFLIGLLGVSTLISDGLFGNGRVFLMALPIIAALLVSERAALGALILSVVLVATTGVLMLKKVIPVPGPATGLGNVNSDLRFWLLAVAVWILVGTISTISLVVMLRGLRNLVEAEQRLRIELDSERASLTTRVQERTRDLERRLNQIRSAGDISRMLGAVLEQGQLLQQAVEQVQRAFELYFAAVYLVDESREYAVLAAGSGEAGARMVADGYKLSLHEGSTVAWSITNQLPKIAFDVGREGPLSNSGQSGAQVSIVRFNNQLLPFTRSELVLPIIITRSEGEQGTSGTAPLASGAHVLGALVIQSTRSQAFDKDDLSVLQGVATSLANALENAQLFQQVQSNLQEIRTLNRQYLEQAWSVQNKSLHSGKLAAVSEDRSLLKQKQLATKDLQLSSWVSMRVPLEVRDQVIGHLELESPSRAPNEARLTEEEQEIVNTVVTEAAIALENIRLLETTQRRASFDRLLAEITSTARSGVDLDSILRSTIRELGQALNAAEAEISLQITPDQPIKPAPVAETTTIEHTEVEPEQSHIPAATEAGGPDAPAQDTDTSEEAGEGL